MNVFAARFVARIAKLRRKRLRWRHSYLWGAPGLRHLLFDAPLPEPKRTETTTLIDSTLIDRIVANYHRIPADVIAVYPVWDYHEGLKEALESRNADSLAEQFANLFRNTLVYSMGHPETYYFGKHQWRPGYQQRRITDLLLSLGEAIGVLPVPCHAQMKLHEYVDFVHTNQDSLFMRIQERVGFSLDMPLIGHPPVFEFAGVTTNADMIRHAYPAVRIREILGGTNASILEIGAGFGSVVLLAYRAGFRNITVIDLPNTGAVQTFFLGTALGVTTVSGLGEQPAAIQLLPPSAMTNIPNASIDLAFNMDSFPEFEKSVGLHYLREIRRTSTYFLSINQEARANHMIFGVPQTRVSDLIEEVGGFERVYRFPYWLLEGYVEELYRVVRR